MEKELVALSPVSRDPSKVFAARPAAAIDRANAFHTLNFRIPWGHVVGTLHLDLETRLSAPIAGLPGSMLAKHTTSAASQVVASPRKNLRLAIMMVQYQGLSPMLKVTGVLDELRDMYPVAEDGVVITQWLGTHTTTRDLSVERNWGELLSDVAEAAEGWPQSYDVLLALLPGGGTGYARGGIGNAKVQYGWPPPSVAVESRGETVAHEVGHALGMGMPAVRRVARTLRRRRPWTERW